MKKVNKELRKAVRQLAWYVPKDEIKKGIPKFFSCCSPYLISLGVVGDDGPTLDKARDIVEHLRIPGDGDDGSWKPLCDDFRALGFEVVDGDSKGKPKKED